MNREIKFRGKSLASGKWVYGDLIKHSKIDPFTYIAIGTGYKVDDPNLGKPIKVFPASVGEYTGMNDKNGKEIYEGDVCGNDGTLKLPVTFANGSFMWGDEALGFEATENGIELTATSKWAEVTGTIHDALQSPEEKGGENK